MKRHARERDQNQFFDRKKIYARSEHGQKMEDSLEIYNKLLLLSAKYPGKIFVVPEIADEVLHMHILRTRHFFGNSQENSSFNKVHHNSEVFGTKFFWEAWEYTVKKFRSEFGIDLLSDGGTAPSLKSGPGYCSVFQLATP
jgi:hypothetical protein